MQQPGAATRATLRSRDDLLFEVAGAEAHLDQTVTPRPANLPAATKDERTMAMLAHLSGLMGGWVFPLILWAIKKDESPYIAYHALQALIFQGVMLVIILILAVPVSLLTCGLGSFLVFGVIPFQIAGAVVYGLRANEGRWEGYPLIDQYGRPT